MEKLFDIHIGVDVGKFSHHITALGKGAEILVDRPVENKQEALESVLSEIKEYSQRCLLVVDQPGNLASLVFAVADTLDIDYGFITPRSMKKSTELLGLYTRTDRVEAGAIATISQRIPELVCTKKQRESLMAELFVLLNLDRSLTVDITRATNRLHDLLFSVHPPLEATLSKAGLTSKVSLLLLGKYGGPQRLKRSGKRRVTTWIRGQKGCRDHAQELIEACFSALEEQSVTLGEAEVVETIISAGATHLMQMVTQRKLIEKRRDEILSHFPEDAILQTMSGLGAITSATVLTEIGSISEYGSAAELACYAGFAPTVKRSGKTVFSSSKPRGGNRRLKRILYLSAERSIHVCEESAVYYAKKRSEGRCHKAAVMALARRRIDVMYAMLRDMTPYKKENG